jgi:hypothetical protein
VQRIRPSDGSTLALAGLYEVWYDKTLPDDDPNRVVPTYTIITTSATDSVGRIHDRMPMAITPDHWTEWLDPRNHDVDQLRALMAPPVDGSLDMYAVSKAVNNVKNNGPELLEPCLPSTDHVVHEAQPPPPPSMPVPVPGRAWTARPRHGRDRPEAHRSPRRRMTAICSHLASRRVKLHGSGASATAAGTRLSDQR